MKVWGMRFGMGCEAQRTAAWLLRRIRTNQTARSRARTPMRKIVNTFLDVNTF